MTSTTEKKAPKAAAQEVCIDLPGESVQCWRSSDNITVKLRKHRDVFFDLNLKVGATYTVQSTSDFYSPRDKKLQRKAQFKDGEKFHVWVGRNFKGNLVLRADGKTLGTYEVNRLDTKSYDGDPKTKPEPLMVIMGHKPPPSSFMCAMDDPYGITETQLPFKLSFDSKLSSLKEYGTEFNYHYSLESRELQEYVAVTEALPHEIQPQVLKQLDAGQTVAGNPHEIFAPPKSDQPPSMLYRALTLTAGYISEGSELLTSNTVKETAGYVQEHFRMLNKVTMRVHIEPKAKGKYKVALKGKPVTKLVSQALGITKRAKVTHESAAMGTKGSAFIDGGYGRSGKAGYGGVKRIMLTTAKNFKSGLKIQGIGTVIDLIGDVNTVYFDENGSKDLSEFLGRAGVSLGKAGVTAALGSLFAAIGVAALSAVTLAAGLGAAPVLAVVVVVIAGYIGAATLIDMVDEQFNIKNGVASMAR